MDVGHVHELHVIERSLRAQPDVIQMPVVKGTAERGVVQEAHAETLLQEAILLDGDQHLLKGGQGGIGRAPDPEPIILSW